MTHPLPEFPSGGLRHIWGADGKLSSSKANGKKKTSDLRYAEGAVPQVLRDVSVFTVD